MTRLCAWLLLAAACTSVLAAESSRPNIVLIMSDDMGFSDLGCYGGEIQTPVLDGLAAGGLRFTQFYNTARCCPTRASLLTGLHPHQAGMGHMTGGKHDLESYAGNLNEHCVTIAEALRPAGYRTYMCGKWHVTRNEGPEGPKHTWPLHRGFDKFYGTIKGGGSFYDPTSLCRGDTFITPENDPEYKPQKFYYTDAISDNAVKFIGQHAEANAGQPFFLYVAYTAAHWPMHALPEDIAKYHGKYDGGYEPIRAARFQRLKQLGLIDPGWPLSPQAGDWQSVANKPWEARCMEVYAAMVDRMDQGIGRIVDELKKSGQLDNTLILFLQDNGGCAEEMGRRSNADKIKDVAYKPFAPDDLQPSIWPPMQTRDGRPVRTGPDVMPGSEDTYIAYGLAWANVSNTPFREYKHWVHEGGIATPLIAHWPRGIAARGELRSQPGQLPDIMATCLDVAGAKYPAVAGEFLDIAGAKYPAEFHGQPITPLEGRSLVPAFTNQPVERDGLFWEHEGNRAVRVGDWKLVAKGPAGPWELYDLRTDRTEMNDLAAQQPAKVKELRSQWEAWARRAHVLPWIWKPAYGEPAEPKRKVRAASAQTRFDLKPNIIFILSDDVAQGDLGCYGQKLIQTPNLDRMAAEGTRYLQAYCGTTVCAPSRASLITGLHMGRCPVRANREIQPEGQMPLPADTLTVAQLVKGRGYATACIGKWGMGMFDTTGSPLKKGFDHFFGYNCQRHAHSYFPTYLYNDDQRFELPGNDGRSVGKTYAQNLIADEVLRWVRSQKDRPFFLFHSVTLPHGRFEIDDVGPYADRPWTPQQKNYAAMVTRLDSDVGRLLKLLDELDLDEKTLVLFSGDNGSSFPPNSEIGRLFEQAANGLRGFKRELYEGGLRQAAIARWPGVVPAGRVSDEAWAFWDFLPTVAELTGAKLPDGFKPDGLSLVSFLKGGPAPPREFFYWELHEGRPIQAIRFGDWKAVRNGPSQPLELYDLRRDPGETKNLAAGHPDLLAKAETLIKAARVDDPNWPFQERAQKRKPSVAKKPAEA